MPESTKQKGKIFSRIIIVLTVAAVAAATVAGYGLYKGSRIKSYAKKAESIFARKDSWEKKLETSDLKKLKKALDEIQEESERSILELGSPLKEGTVLDTKLKEFFAASKKSAQELEKMVVWMEEAEEITAKSFDFSDLDTSTPEAMTSNFKKAKADLEAAVQEMESATPPDSLKKDHEEIKNSLTSFAELYGKLITAMESNDISLLATISTDFTTLSESMNAEDFSGKALEAYKAEAQKTTNIEREISAEIMRLKGINLSF